VISSATGLFATVARKKLAPCELDASIGAPGPHDFAVRDLRCSSRAHPRPPHPAAHVRDDRETPLVWDGMARDKPVIWVACEVDYFSRDDWTGQIKLKWFEKLACARSRQNSSGIPKSAAICGIRRKGIKNPGFRGAGHRARICATRWLIRLRLLQRCNQAMSHWPLWMSNLTEPSSRILSKSDWQAS
jgi:hypothetical protein